MKSKMVSILISILMVTNISGAITQNVGVSSSSIGETIGPPLSKVSTLTSQIVRQPSSGLSGTGGLADSPWPMFRQNLNHTGLSPYDTSANPGKLKWSFMTGHYVDSSSAIGSDGTIYVGSCDNKLYAINPDGTEKWSFMTNSYVFSSPAIGSDGTIYVGSNDNNLYAIYPDGTEKWSFPTGGNILSSPMIGSDGTIYVGSDDDNLYAINPDGTEKWSFATNGYVHSSPAFSSENIIYISSYDNNLYAIYPDGTEKWHFTTGDILDSSPSIGSDGTIYVGSYDHKLYAINPDGSEKWSFITPLMVWSSPAIGSNGTIYIGSAANKLYAINPDGTEKWNFSITGDVWSPSIGSDGTIYVGSDDDNLHAINPDGTEKWNFMIGDDVRSSPAIGSDGTIYVGSDDHKLYAIGKTEIPPIANAGPDQTVNEGDTVQFDASASYDPDGTIEIYEWDFDKEDGLWWETGATPDAVGVTAEYTYGDDGGYNVTLRVTDDEGLSGIDICNITVLNVDPTVTIESATMDVEIGLRVAGRKYNDVGMSLYEDGNPIGYVSIERMPGSPNDQMAWIPITLDMTKTYNATVIYTPEDPPDIGANPVWIYIKFKNGTVEKIHHTFNVQQSKKRDSDHWNHVESWEVDLNIHLIGCQFEVTSHITDPGSDDETFTFTYGSQVKTITYLNNPPNPDPFPSPEVKPMDTTDTTTLVYEGPGTVTLVVKDDDNIRLGVGQGSNSITVA